uniref:Uncharacterized protein n=1 Tax=Oryza meridionalis TaxID=40149 RepID=A0A0E0CT57_9ORYZ
RKPRGKKKERERKESGSRPSPVRAKKRRSTVAAARRVGWAHPPSSPLNIRPAKQNQKLDTQLLLYQLIEKTKPKS